MEQNERVQRNASPESGEAPTQEGLTARPPAFQLMASPVAPPVQMKVSSIKDFTIIQTGTTESEVEGTVEFKQFMDSTSVYQSQLHLSRDEARLACLLMVEANLRGENVDMAAVGLVFGQQARDRLNPQANHKVIPRLGMEIHEVSETRAQELFNQLAALTFWNDKGEDTPIPFHYPIDGCYARAHLMSERLTAMGYGSRKQFAVSKDQAGNPDLHVQTNLAEDSSSPLPTVNWWYHVAPIIQVRLANGSIVEKVIDPSMTNGPVAISDWTGRMNTSSFQVLSLSEVKAEVAKHGGNHPLGQKVTFSADRAMTDPFDFGSHSDASAHSMMNAARPDLSDYAINAPAHTLASEIRGGLTSGSLDSSEIAVKISHLSPATRKYFKGQFVRLLLSVKSVVGQGWSSIENALIS